MAFLPPAPFIVGAPRSGTTLLRLMLDAHPNLAIPPETGFFSFSKDLCARANLSREDFIQSLVSFPPEAPAWNDFHISRDEFDARIMNLNPFHAEDGFRLFYKMYAERFDKLRWGDKTPLHARYLLDIQAVLPEAHFIHIVRDGRDVSISLREQWFSPGHDIKTQAVYWMENVETAHAQGGQCKYYLEIRFEDLILQTETTLLKICKFIELDFHLNMLLYHENASQRIQEHLERHKLDGNLLVSQSARQKQQDSSMKKPDPAKIGMWKRLLTQQEIEQYEAIAAKTLQRYGYSLLSK